MQEREPITDPEDLEFVGLLLREWLEYLLEKPENFESYLKMKTT